MPDAVDQAGADGIRFLDLAGASGIARGVLGGVELRTRGASRMPEPQRMHPHLVLVAAIVMIIVASPAVAQEETAEGVLIPDGSGDLLNYYSYEPFDGEWPAYLDVLSIGLSVDGDDLVVRFEIGGPVPDEPVGAVYMLNVDRDEDLDPDVTVVLGLGGDGPDGVLWDNVSGEPVLLAAPDVADSAITARVPLHAVGPLEGATASAEVSAEWLADPDDIFSGVFAADPVPGVDEAWVRLDTLAGLVPSDGSEE
jgi:hypothetical protein